MSEIRKQYRKLSKIFHPDKQGGDQAMFMKIAKAYEAYVLPPVLPPVPSLTLFLFIRIIF